MIHRIKLEHLVELMQSDSGPDRLVAEYIRLKQWYESIKEFNNSVEAGKYLERPVITPDTNIPYEMSKELQSNIGNLLHTIEVAAVIEDIDLEDAINYYIQKALKAEREYHGFTACECRTTEEIEREKACRNADRDDAESAIMNIPDADVVAVVRCGECKYCDLTDEGEYNPNDIVCCYFMTDGMEANDYCSRGERREE